MPALSQDFVQDLQPAPSTLVLSLHAQSGRDPCGLSPHLQPAAVGFAASLALGVSVVPVLQLAKVNANAITATRINRIMVFSKVHGISARAAEV